MALLTLLLVGVAAGASSASSHALNSTVSEAGASISSSHLFETEAARDPFTHTLGYTPAFVWGERELSDRAFSAGPRMLAITTACAAAAENRYAAFICPSGFRISGIQYASYGQPIGGCPR